MQNNLLAKSNFQQSTLPWGSSDLNSCSTNPSDSDPSLQNRLKSNADKNTFYQLFLTHYQQVGKTFEFINKWSDDPTRPFSISVTYFCQDDKTISFPNNWQINNASKQTSFSDWQSDDQDKISLQGWSEFLQRLFRNHPKKWYSQIPNLSPKEKDAFEQIFFKAYLYFVRLVNVQLYSEISFLSFLENIKADIIRVWSQRLLYNQKAHWLGYLPGADLKALGPDKIDLTLILNLDPKTLNLETLSPQQNDFFLKQKSKKAYDFSYNHPWHQSYKEFHDAFRDLTFRKKNNGFWTTLSKVLNNDLGIQLLFFNNEEYSLANLLNFWKLHDINDVNKQSFWFMDSPSMVELTKIIFGNKRGIQDGVDSAPKLQQRLDETKNKLLTDLKTALDQLVAFDSTITQLSIKGKTYALDQLISARDKLLNDQLDQKVIDQIKPLFSNQIYATDIIKKINSLSSQLRKKNLAIGLGTAGAVVALAGASGFAYWFLKIRKS